MLELVITWLPFVIILAVALVMGRKQMKDYGSHVRSVTQVNDSILDLTRKTHALTQEQLVVLKEIKLLLEDRKS